MTDLQVAMGLVRPATIHGFGFQGFDPLESGVKSRTGSAPVLSLVSDLSRQAQAADGCGHFPLAQMLVIVREVADAIVLTGGRGAGLGHIVTHVRIV